MKEYLAEHREFRSQIIHLAWLDMTRKYRRSMLGWAWAIVHPLILLFVYWFAIKVGLRVSIAKGSVDLLPWLAAGLLAWFFISDVINAGTSSFRTHKYLITKMRFPIAAIPTIVVLSKLFVHFFMMAIVMVFLAIDGSFSIYWLQLPFYMLLMALFCVAWTMFAAPLAAISKDFAELVKSASRILFWLSGIIWNVRTLEIDWLRHICTFNPVTFFVEGYRNSLIYERWFWQEPKKLIAFGLVFLIIIILAIHTYRRTRKELADAL
jgi:teichoic acid transport system permease protein